MRIVTQSPYALQDYRALGWRAPVDLVRFSAYDCHHDVTHDFCRAAQLSKSFGPHTLVDLETLSVDGMEQDTRQLIALKDAQFYRGESCVYRALLVSHDGTDIKVFVSEMRGHVSLKSGETLEDIFCPYDGHETLNDIRRKDPLSASLRHSVYTKMLEDKPVYTTY